MFAQAGESLECGGSILISLGEPVVRVDTVRRVDEGEAGRTSRLGHCRPHAAQAGKGESGGETFEKCPSRVHTFGEFICDGIGMELTLRPP